MVLGLRSKTKKGTAVHTDFIIHIQDIRPWPPSESLKSLRSVVLLWENGDRSSGATNHVTPSVGASSMAGKIEFNESFKIKVSFQKEGSSKSGKFQKNVLEMNLYEPRSNKLKGQHLGTVTIDLAEHAIIQEAVSISVPLSSKRSLKNNAQPLIYLRIQPLDGDGSSTSSRDGLSKESLTDKDGKELISALMCEEYSEEAEIASFTDDEDEEPPFLSSLDRNAGQGSDGAQEHLTGAKESAAVGNAGASSSSLSEPERGYKPSTATSRLNGDAIGAMDDVTQDVKKKKIEVRSKEVQKYPIQDQKTNDNPGNLLLASDANFEQTQAIQQQSILRTGRKMSFAYGMINSDQRYFGDRTLSTLTGDRAKSMRFSMRVPSEANGIVINEKIDQQKENVKEVDSQEIPSNCGTKTNADDVMQVQEPIRILNNRNDSKVRELELRVELLEAELREAAAVEIGLYSIVAEHGSSAHKVHTPARRLSRLFIHALKNLTREKMGSAARSASSGLVSVAKACGNDVARLSFWFSNCVVLRAIVTQASKLSEISQSNGSNSTDKNPKTVPKRSSVSMWESVNRKKGKLLSPEFDNWEDLDTFVSALKKIESWIFSRIVESIWWQTFTPNMQSVRKSSESKTTSTTKKSYGRITVVGNQQQANLSTEIWKKAFKEASERLCPVRAAGHECGCLPMLAKLVMEQCIARLDVAMFNAILRESDDEIPTDPMSDPITDPKVLPVPSGKCSFGAGAQLKNTIGSWSRWLSDLFGMDMDDYLQVADEKEEDKRDVAGSFKPFHLLHALSDLLMLPKDMLLESATRKELCPTFSSPIIKQILDSFIPDEFCPDPIPESVLEALETEDHLGSSNSGVRVVPCSASPITYSAPAVAAILSIVGEVQSRKSGSSIVRKSNTSDDELDELSSPLTTIANVSSDPLAKLKRISNSHTVRHRLLLEVWKIDD